MVVCHCEAVNDAALCAAIESAEGAVGELTIDDIVARCGAGGHCGGCHDTIREMVARLTPDGREMGLPSICTARTLGRA